MTLVGHVLRGFVGNIGRLARFSRKPIGGQEGCLPVEPLGVVKHIGGHLHDRRHQAVQLRVPAFRDRGQVVRLRQVDDPLGGGLVESGRLVVAQPAAQVVAGLHRVGRGLGQRRGTLTEPEPGGDDGVGYQRGLRQVDDGRRRRQAQEPDEP